jgi:hypothetical protein
MDKKRESNLRTSNYEKKKEDKNKKKIMKEIDLKVIKSGNKSRSISGVKLVRF